MRTFELINFSDKVLVTSDDAQAVCGAAMLLSPMYGLQEIGGDFEMPIGAQRAWLEETFGPYDGPLVDHLGYERLAAALDAFHYPEGYEPTSLNEIVAKAKWWANKVREIAAEKKTEGVS